MKNLGLTLFFAIILSTGNSFAIEYMFSGTFRLEFEDNVRIRIGGATENKSTSQWEKGGKVGNTAIDPETFAKMKESTSEYFKIEIAKNGPGNLRDVWVTDLSTNNRVKGLYNTQQRGFMFGTSKATPGNGDCGSFETGVVKGYLTEDMKSIEKGEYTVGFIAGCKPVIIAADATFYYSGKPIDEKGVTINTGTEGESKGNAGRDVSYKDKAEEKTKSEPEIKTVEKEVKQPSAGNNGLVGKWKIGMHKKGLLNISHPGSDFVEFGANGSYAHVLKGSSEKGTWEVSPDGSTLTVKANATATWKITKQTDSQVVLKKGDETLILAPF